MPIECETDKEWWPVSYGPGCRVWSWRVPAHMLLVEVHLFINLMSSKWKLAQHFSIFSLSIEIWWAVSTSMPVALWAICLNRKKYLMHHIWSSKSWVRGNATRWTTAKPTDWNTKQTRSGCVRRWIQLSAKPTRWKMKRTRAGYVRRWTQLSSKPIRWNIKQNKGRLCEEGEHNSLQSPQANKSRLCLELHRSPNPNPESFRLIVLKGCVRADRMSKLPATESNHNQVWFA